MAYEELAKPHKGHPYSGFYNRLYDSAEKAKAASNKEAVDAFRKRIESGELPSSIETQAMIDSAISLGDFLARHEILLDFTEVYSGTETKVNDIIDKSQTT